MLKLSEISEMIDIKKLLMPLLIIIVLVSIKMLEVADYNDLEKMLSFQSWIDNWNYLAPLFFILVYALAMIFFLPNAFFMLTAGIIFGSFKGSLIASAGFVLGAGSAFILSRYLARDFIDSWLSNKELKDKIDKWFVKYNWRVLLITRLIPIFPINLQNYIYGSTEIKFSTYILLSCLAMLPKIIIFVWLGTLIVD